MSRGMKGGVADEIPVIYSISFLWLLAANCWRRILWVHYSFIVNVSPSEGRK